MGAGRSISQVMRRCIGCRTSDTVSELLRVVAQGSHLVPDPKRRLAGRGAYVHPTRECIAAARPRWARALRVPGPVEIALAEFGPPPGARSDEDATDRESAVRTSTR